jgi:hypothetical protein
MYSWDLLVSMFIACIYSLSGGTLGYYFSIKYLYRQQKHLRISSSAWCAFGNEEGTDQ